MRALRGVLACLPEAPAPPTGASPPAPVGLSVEEGCGILRALMTGRGVVGFDELFVGVATRQEAIALFLALLELIRRDEMESRWQTRGRGPCGARRGAGR